MNISFCTLRNIFDRLLKRVGRLSRGFRASLILGAGFRVGYPRPPRPGPVARLLFGWSSYLVNVWGRLHDEARRSRRREVVPRRPSGLDPEDRLPGRVSPAAKAGSLGPVPFGRSNFSESGVEGALPDGRLLAYVVSESLPAPAIVAGTCSGF